MNEPAPDPQPDGGEQARKQIERVLLGSELRYTRGEVAELSGVPLERLQDRWRALGFASVDDDAVLFTDADVEAAKMSEQFVDTGLIGREMDASVTRAIGHHLSRLAEWQAQLMWQWLSERPELARDPNQAGAVIAAILPVLERTQSYVWRRHLAAYAGRTFEADDEEGQQQVVGFVDMVGYTRLTRKIGEAGLSTVLERFEALASGVIAQWHGRVVKMIGDEVLFMVDRPDQAVEIALALNERAATDPDLPELRSGLAYGRVLSRLGDVYGPVVNIAARLTSTARPGTILLDEQLATEVSGDDRFDVHSIRPTSVRGYSRLHRYVVRRAEATG